MVFLGGKSMGGTSQRTPAGLERGERGEPGICERSPWRRDGFLKYEARGTTRRALNTRKNRAETATRGN